jgi:uncharacterized DUF497 family protein
MKFEWDINKASANLKKHKVDFSEAIEALKDEFGLDDFDRSHSDVKEYRYTRIGLSRKDILFVIYVMRSENDVYRIISARKAAKSEEELYWEARYE